MNIQLTGRHLEITPAIRDYVTGKFGKIKRHFDNVIDVNVILSVEKLKQKAEATVHISGKDVFVECDDENLYAAIDASAFYSNPVARDARGWATDWRSFSMSQRASSSRFSWASPCRASSPSGTSAPTRLPCR